MKLILWTTWPAGVVLVVAATEGLVPPLVFAVLDAVYLVAVVFAARRAGGLVAWLAAPAAVIFAVASWTGIPTAREPGRMLANAAMLAVAAAILVVAAVLIAGRVWDGPGRAPALLAIALLVVGTAGYAANLLARFAFVLSGAASAQAAVEDEAWQAHAYLQGLDGPPAPFTTLLVWLDLLQFAYVLAAYSAVALLAVALARANRLPSITARGIAGLGGVLTIAALATAAAAMVSPLAAGVAFALTIPFMSTLLPSLLAAGLPTEQIPTPPDVPALR